MRAFEGGLTTAIIFCYVTIVQPLVSVVDMLELKVDSVGSVLISALLRIRSITFA